MAGIISAVGIVKQIFDVLDKSGDKSPKEIAGEILRASAGSKGTLLRTDGSITKLLSSYIVEPVIIATHGTRETKVIDKILETNVDIFASFYLQAFEILRNIHGIKDGIIIDVLGTDKGAFNLDMARIAHGAMVSKEDLGVGQLELLLSNENLCLSIENDKPKDDNAQKEPQIFDQTSKRPGFSKSGKEAQDHPLSTLLQRNIEVTISTFRGENKDKHIVVIPITIKAHVLFVSTDNLLTMLKPNSTDKTFSYRLDEYRAGVISLADLLFCGDLIKKYKDNKLDDKAKLLELLNDRTLSANAKLSTSSMVGYEKYYNMLVITDDDKVRLDKHLNGNLTDEKYKERLLEQAKAMTCTVIDLAYERLYILTKDIRGKTDISFNAISKRKDNNADLSEVVRSLLSNRPPVF